LKIIIRSYNLKYICVLLSLNKLKGMSDPEINALMKSLADKGVEVLKKVDVDSMLRWRFSSGVLLGFITGFISCYIDMKSDIKYLKDAV
jgi:hypothetical protein